MKQNKKIHQEKLKVAVELKFINSNIEHFESCRFIFAEINKRGGANKLRGGGQNLPKLISGGARLFGTLE